MARQLCLLLALTSLTLLACRAGEVETVAVENPDIAEPTPAEPSEPNDLPTPVNGFIITTVGPVPTSTQTPSTPKPAPTVDLTETTEANSDEAQPTAEPTRIPAPSPVATPIPPLRLAEIFPADDWCSAARKLETNQARLTDVNRADPVRLEEFYAASVLTLQQAQQVAPDILDPHVTVLLESVQTVQTALAEVAFDQLDLDLGLTASLTRPVLIANFNIDRYNFEQCGFDNGFDPANDPATQPEPDTDDLNGTTLRQRASEQLFDSGHTPAEIECLLDGTGLTDPRISADAARVQEIYANCGISADRLAELAG